MCRPDETVTKEAMDDPNFEAESDQAETTDENIEVHLNDTSIGDKEGGEEDKEPELSKCQKIWKWLVNFYWDNEFLILVIIAILLARAYPPLGAIYLAPQITATWVAVCFIFLMAGLGLKTEEFSKALQQVWFNLYVQVFNFGVDSAFVYGISRLLALGNIIGQDLADGMAIAASLPMTINMVLVLTKAAGGDEAAAIFNAAFGNLVGVFLSPVLILGYLGVSGSIDLANVFYKLALRVLLPILIGQLLQKFCKPVNDFVKKYKKYFKKAQQYCLVFIVYTVFCTTFYKGNNSSVADIFLMITFMFLIITFLMVVAWYSLKLLFRDHPKLRVMGLFGCTHKTVAMGVPLINAIYEDNPAVGLYTLPLLIWHPMQLVIGSFLAPRLMKFVESESERLGIGEEEGGQEFATTTLSTPGVGDSSALSDSEEGRIAVRSQSLATGTQTSKGEDDV